MFLILAPTGGPVHRASGAGKAASWSHAVMRRRCHPRGSHGPARTPAEPPEWPQAGPLCWCQERHSRRAQGLQRRVIVERPRRDSHREPSLVAECAGIDPTRPSALWQQRDPLAGPTRRSSPPPRADGTATQGGAGLSAQADSGPVLAWRGSVQAAWSAFYFFFHDRPTPVLYILSLPAALPAGPPV